MPEQRAELRRLCEATPSGPWHKAMPVSDDPNAGDEFSSIEQSSTGVVLAEIVEDDIADFIAASRTALPDLLDCVETLEQLLQQKRDQVRRIRKEARDYKKWKDLNTFMELRERIRKLESEIARWRACCEVGVTDPGYKLTITIEATAPAAAHSFCGKGSTVEEAVRSLGEMMKQSRETK